MFSFLIFFFFTHHIQLTYSNYIYFIHGDSTIFLLNDLFDNGVHTSIIFTDVLTHHRSSRSSATILLLICIIGEFSEYCVWVVVGPSRYSVHGNFTPATNFLRPPKADTALGGLRNHYNGRSGFQNVLLGRPKYFSEYLLGDKRLCHRVYIPIPSPSGRIIRRCCRYPVDPFSMVFLGT